MRELDQHLVATKCYDGQFEFETVTQLIGTETARRLGLLKADLEGEPPGLAAPGDVDVYGTDATAVETAVGTDGEWSWLYAAIDPDSKLLLGGGHSERRGTDPATEIRRQPTE